MNPRQFNVGGLHAVPAQRGRDLAICEAEGVDLVFAPRRRGGLPARASIRPSRSGPIAEPLEGAARPGHFDGVATVVAILFGLVGADHAYFGQKDAQQVMVIRQMARDLAIPTTVIACPTDPRARRPRDVVAQRPPVPGRTGGGAGPAPGAAGRARRWAAGERDADVLRATMRDTHRRRAARRVDYVSCADGATLAELDRVDGPALLSLAVRFGTTRLIDNEPLVTAGTDR